MIHQMETTGIRHTIVLLDIQTLLVETVRVEITGVVIMEQMMEVEVILIIYQET